MIWAFTVPDPPISLISLISDLLVPMISATHWSCPALFLTTQTGANTKSRGQASYPLAFIPTLSSSSRSLWSQRYLQSVDWTIFSPSIILLMSLFPTLPSLKSKVYDSTCNIALQITSHLVWKISKANYLCYKANYSCSYFCTTEAKYWRKKIMSGHAHFGRYCTIWRSYCTELHLLGFMFPVWDD